MMQKMIIDSFLAIFHTLTIYEKQYILQFFKRYAIISCK